MSIAVDSKGNPIYPKPCKVVMVLSFSHPSGQLLRMGAFWSGQIVGVYRLDDPAWTMMEFKSQAEALEYIHNHGGEWIAGEPLPWVPVRAGGNPQ